MQPSLVNRPTLFRKILPIYWAILTFLLLAPASETHKIKWFHFPGLDKVVHFGTFLILGLVFKLAFPKKQFISYMMLMLIYGLATEILQDEMNWGRSLDLLDLLADTLGAILGFILSQLLLTKNK